MTQQYKQKKILIIQGPNMNLLGHRFKDTKTKITLDKLNAHLRKTANKHKIILNPPACQASLTGGTETKTAARPPKAV